MKKYDFLVVGAGLFGATFARRMTDKGFSCLVIDKRNHVAGNAYTENVDGINVHKYGAHIFHTSLQNVWTFVNRFASFNGFVNSPIAVCDGEVYNLPFNMNTFAKLWKGVVTPEQARNKISLQIAAEGIISPSNLEEQALSLVGKDVYEKLIKGYTEKQWGKSCKDLSADVIKRIPVRFTYNNNYFNDVYQGVPIGGYTKMVENMLKGIDVLLGTDYEQFVRNFNGEIGKTVYCGTIDGFFGYCLGKLEYRSVRFETEKLDTQDYQGNAVVNYTSASVPYTRIIEHKHFEFGTQPFTIISKEYPCLFDGSNEPCYPIDDEKNRILYQSYKQLESKHPNVIFGGRLGLYSYLDMDKTIQAALNLANSL